jgi:hypothetical protein
VSALSNGDAEFLLEKAATGEVRIRVGQIWKIPERKGQTPLLCDYDNCRKIDRKTIHQRLRKAGVEIIRIQSRRSPSGSGVHAIVWIRGRFPGIERICLQAIIESDPEREAQNFRRLKQANRHWEENWQALFEKGK